MSSPAIVFLVPGQAAAQRSADPSAPGAPTGGVAGLDAEVRAAVRVGARRAGAATQRVDAVPGQDVVVLELDGGPALVLHPETARDLLLGQGTRGRSAGAGQASPDTVEVPAELRWRGLEQAAPTRSRGFLGNVMLRTLQVLRPKAAKVAADQLKDRIDGQVAPGLYRLARQSLGRLKGAPPLAAADPALQADAAAGPLLVLLHGTFVDTASTFGKLWGEHPGAVQRLFDHYGDRVYALDHPTLGASPIANALTLVQALPAGARLHLATHSRGGLVAEVLARVAGQGGVLDADELKPFAGSAQQQELLDLAREVKARGIVVERVVRVACPARGTLLASRRLDAYLSVLKWTLELARVPVAPALLGFLAEVARERHDPARLPGLAAMLPDSPLVQWLNSAAATDEGAIAGELRVVAGDLEADSLGSWVKTLLADAFFWTDNDVVVQTRSMYGGTPRAGGASFLLDQGGGCTHFAYFSNPRSAHGVVDALVLDRPPHFRTIGPLSWAGADSSGVRAARRPPDAPPPEQRPAVFLLPGILGSHLTESGKRIWLSWRLIGGLGRLRWRGEAEERDGKVKPDAPIGMFYDALAAHLGASHEVIPFAFDWRRPIEDEARRLADAVARELALRDGTRQPVRIVAHSMGGVVARTMQIVADDVWDRMMARDGARLLMLGTPNGGSWAPMQVLSGDDSFGNTLTAFGAPFQDHEARRIMAAMPGFIQLQADLLDDQRRLDDEATWKDLAERDLAAVREANWWHTQGFGGDSPLALTPYRWGVPPQAVLNQARALREKLDHQRAFVLPAFADRLLLVTGRARFTPDGFQWTDRGLVYRNAVDGGDGRVTLASAMLPGVRTWAARCDHGKLPDEASAFDAYLELLERGDTSKLPRLGPAQRCGEAAATAATDAVTVAHVDSRPSRGQPLAARAAEDFGSLLAPPDADAAAAEPQRGQALEVSVVNGDLTFVRAPLLVGHYRSTSLTGTEWVVDRMLGGAMSAALDAGLYPQDAGRHQVFVNATVAPGNPFQAPRPEAAVVIGLGDEGLLKAPLLADGVRQATLAWCQRLAERPDAPATFELAATLLGSGGLGVSPGEAACAIARGVLEAAEIVRKGNDERRAKAERARDQRADARPAAKSRSKKVGAGAASDDNEGSGATIAPAPADVDFLAWPVPTRLALIELYLERASDAWRALQIQASAMPGQFVIGPTVVSGIGALRRQIDTTYRGIDYDLIIAEMPAGAADSIRYRVDTRRARTELNTVATQGKLVRQLVGRAAQDREEDRRIGSTLFQLLVPQEMEVHLAGTERMVLELDDETAAIPWELLQSPADGRHKAAQRPWAIRTRLLRKLRKTHFRARPQDAGADDHVLVVGEPLLRDARYVPLPGALAEAKAVAAKLAGPQGVDPSHVRLLEQQDAQSILNTLFGGRWRIVHIAGHGEPGREGGLVMSDGTFLGPREIAQMRTVPELVFVNCCHLAGRDAPLPPVGRPPLDLPAFAASVADALIEAGVRCVIAAGWAVDDADAETFAATLYDALLAGRSFIDAVALAREAAWHEGESGNTWAAYQCYGDPDWRFRRRTGDAQTGHGDPIREAYEGISSPLGLALALEKLAVQARHQGGGARRLDHVRHLEARFGALWGGMGAVAEAFALAYAEAGQREQAVAWYGQAVAAADASASIKAAEQWLNLRVRLAVDRAEKAAQSADPGSPREAGRKRTIAEALAEITAARETLERIAALPSLERLMLCGSACKHLAIVNGLAGDEAAAQAARAASAGWYEKAERLAVERDLPDLFYPAQNRMATALASHAPGDDWPGFDAEVVARARASVREKMQADPDFWCMVAAIEIDAFEAVAAGRLAGTLPDLARRALDLKARMPAPKSWDSTARTAHYALDGWAGAAGAGERKAVQSWLALLDGYAGRSTAPKA